MLWTPLLDSIAAANLWQKNALMGEDERPWPPHVPQTPDDRLNELGRWIAKQTDPSVISPLLSFRYKKVWHTVAKHVHTADERLIARLANLAPEKAKANPVLAVRHGNELAHHFLDQAPPRWPQLVQAMFVHIADMGSMRTEPFSPEVYERMVEMDANLAAPLLTALPSTPEWVLRTLVSSEPHGAVSHPNASAAVVLLAMDCGDEISPDGLARSVRSTDAIRAVFSSATDGDEVWKVLAGREDVPQEIYRDISETSSFAVKRILAGNPSALRDPTVVENLSTSQSPQIAISLIRAGCCVGPTLATLLRKIAAPSDLAEALKSFRQRIETGEDLGLNPSDMKPFLSSSDPDIRESAILLLSRTARGRPNR